ncbi:MAG: hypothetical protein K6G38_05650 [Gammaproteobacteria bacterium]|nr:hypothetical protein [Gammaproteobacteria bacterium]
MSKLKLIEKYNDIESEFFEIDKEKRIGYVTLKLDNANDMFDNEYISKKPIISEKFNDLITNSFELIPDKYNLDITVSIKDLNGHVEEELKKIYEDNIFLNLKKLQKEIKIKNVTGISLIIAGTISFIAMMLIKRFWVTSDFIHEIFFYILDIATTVLFWEAAGLTLVDSKKTRKKYKSTYFRLSNIKFVKEDNDGNKD